MKGHGEKRSRKTEQFIAALLTESTVEAAARKAGIGDVTAWRWMNDRAFADQYREARRGSHAQFKPSTCGTSWGRNTLVDRL